MVGFIIILVGLASLGVARSKLRGQRVFGEVRDGQEQFFFSHQKRNHFDYTDDQTWAQRYYLDRQYFDPKEGGVLLYICGEYNCPGVPGTRQWPTQIAKQTKSLILVLQHRFYGKSIPSSLQTASYNLLTKEQALADLAYFLNYVRSTNMFNVTNNPWYTIGGSYPGALSAWFRYKYPHLTVGAIASSAVVNMIEDFWQFDQQIYNSAMKTGKGCASSIKKLSDYVDSILDKDDSETLRMKNDFKAEQLNAGEFRFFFIDIIVETIQYGKRTELCSHLYEEPEKSYAYIKELAAKTNADPADYGSYYLSNVSYSGQVATGARSWAWQVCSQVGWFQTPSRQNPMRSPKLDMSFWLRWCMDSFGTVMRPHISEGNTELGKDNLDVSNLIMTNGDEDPWRWASLQKSQGQVISHVIECKDCAHCVDLYTPEPQDSKQLSQVRAQQLKSVKKWISEYWTKHRKERLPE